MSPGALLFGGDLPGTRARRPFEEADVGLIVEASGGERAGRVLHDNAAGWYMRDLKGVF